MARKQVDPGDASAAHDAALYLLEHRARSSGEIRERLRQRGFEPGIIEAEVERLHGVGLLDDAAFARAWVTERERLSPRSASMLRYELAGKGIDPEIAEAATAEVDDVDVAIAIVERKIRSGRTDAKKLSGLLKRRGFRYDAIRAALASIEDLEEA